MGSTKDVVDHHLKSFGEGDLKGILSDYAPGAILFTPEGPLRGVDAIRQLFQAMLAEFGKPGVGHVRFAGGQDRDSVIRRQNRAQALKTRLHSKRPRDPQAPSAPAAYRQRLTDMWSGTDDGKMELRSAAGL